MPLPRALILYARKPSVQWRSGRERVAVYDGLLGPLQQVGLVCLAWEIATANGVFQLLRAAWQAEGMGLITFVTSFFSTYSEQEAYNLSCQSGGC